ncbi:MAG: hypothetical protein C5B47_04105 [Verrucomicrobia bacterium]|nr:MAG: hypothetical protein C5B47_04105 [Verrucomicrobiota bacterium]
MKTPTQTYKSTIVPPLICAGIFALASWLLFALTDPKTDTAALYRLNTLKLLREKDRQRLESYGWVDRSKGWVRIPISQAMKLEEQRLHATPPHPSAASFPFVPVSVTEVPP